jgi:hypothetical protein
MKLRDLGSNKTYDTPSEIGRKLVAAGLAEEVISDARAARPAHEIQFGVHDGPLTDDYQAPPLVTWRCETCGELGYTTSYKGSAHLMVIRHRGTTAQASEEVAARYGKMFGAWAARSKKKPKDVVSASSPVTFIHAAGLKTKQELIAEQKSGLLTRLGV